MREKDMPTGKGPNMKIVNIVDDGANVMAHAYDRQGDPLTLTSITALLTATLTSYIGQGYPPDTRHEVASALAGALVSSFPAPGPPEPSTCLCPSGGVHPMCLDHSGQGLDRGGW